MIELKTRNVDLLIAEVVERQAECLLWSLVKFDAALVNSSDVSVMTTSIVMADVMLSVCTRQNVALLLDSSPFYSDAQSTVLVTVRIVAISSLVSKND